MGNVEGRGQRARPISAVLADVDSTLVTATDWYVRSQKAPRVDRESSTTQSKPTVVASFEGMLTGVVKIVGVSEDYDKVARCEAELQNVFGTQVSAGRSQPYYLDVTHPTANKGTVIERLARYLKIPPGAIATLGDQATDVLMFQRSGLSVAMGNASADVQRQATHVSTSCEDEGFANAVNQFILPRTDPAGADVMKATGQLHRLGRKRWQPDDVVLGGGNAKKLKGLPPGCRAGTNAYAFIGGFRLWEKETTRRRPARTQPPRAA